MYSLIEHNNLIINQDFLEVLKRSRLDDFWLLKNYEGGGLLKKNRYRSVVRIEVTEGQEQKVFYLKRHFWPLKERIKYLMPWSAVEDAGNEWNNMSVLEECGFHTMVPVAFGEEKQFGMPYFSMTLTEGIDNAEKLETYCPSRFTPPLRAEQVREKRALIWKLAALAADFHSRGLNHQDFYLGHLMIRPEDGTLFILDIQRVHRRVMVSSHDRIKDLAQLAFSAQRLNVFTRTDLMRFVRTYLGKERTEIADRRMIRKILAKAERIARHDVKLRGRKERPRQEGVSGKT